VILSTAIAYGRGLRIKPPPLLAEFTSAQVAGVPILAIFVTLLAALLAVVLHRTVYGRTVVAIGQSQRAAGQMRRSSPASCTTESRRWARSSGCSPTRASTCV
jgi:ribose/xylose/arabinose/galactoside ABC-type transport system permease subunit